MKRQRGAALMVILLIVGVLAALFAVRALNGATAERDKVTSAALAQAKDALIGYAATYRENRPTHSDEVFGFLPCPDTNNDGNAEASCGLKDVSTVGRLPWKTLGLPALRDGAGECLWYAVAGRAKDNPKTDVLNWDTTGQFIVVDVDGLNLAGATAHLQPVAVVFAPRATLGAQDRDPAGATAECGGSVAATSAQYLESAFAPVAGMTSTFTLGTLASARAGTNNDQGNWITAGDVFDRVRQRGEFKKDIDSMLDDLAFCLNGTAVASLPNASPTSKGVGDYPASAPPPPDPTPTDVLSMCRPGVQKQLNVLQNWQDQLLYAKPAGVSVVGSGMGCSAVLLFGGARAGGQARATAADKLLVANYLEGGNATLFPGAGTYTAAGYFVPASASADLGRCITGLLPGAVQQSFAKDLGSLVSVGTGVTVNAATQSVSIAGGAGVSGGCLWSPTSVPVAGKTLRAYFDYQLSFTDAFALTGGVDRGNGFALQMVRGDFGVEPNTCGTKTYMGVLGSADTWGHDSFIFETDVHRDVARSDPLENHSAILLDGFLDHAPAAPSATISTACNGTATGCRHTPANKFEETPPQTHNQRIEIHSGCNAACTVCNPPAHAAPNNYARITAWVDCKDCSDTAADINRLSKVPTIQRCVALNPVMNTIYLGFTGGFQSGAPVGAPPQQGVTLTNFMLRSE